MSYNHIPGLLLPADTPRMAGQIVLEPLPTHDVFGKLETLPVLLTYENTLVDLLLAIIANELGL